MRTLLIIKLFRNLLNLFSEKGSTHKKITLVEEYFIFDNNDVAEVLNKFFINVV